MKITDIHIGQEVCFKHTNGKLSIPMTVVGIFTTYEEINQDKPHGTVYLDFEGNEGDVWEEEIENIVAV